MNIVHQAQPANWYQPLADESSTDSQRVLCTLCPRACKLKPGDKGFCFVRENQAGKMVLATYGRSTGFCVDPIEKKPLNHFFPGTPVLSFGTAGCNLGCKFCQNWDISKSREIERLSATASPASIAEAAASMNCTSVAFTYNDPVIWAEYAIDTAKACHARGIKSVAVTAGYITEAARGDFFQYMDAANIDLKAFTEDFYFSVTASHLQPVLDTLIFLKNETNVWFEITNLVIPDANDSTDELRRMCDWVYDNLGPHVPLHFSAFHPDYRMMDRPRTPPETLHRAYEIAKNAGIHFPYVGNIHDQTRQNTYCPNCKELLIQRDWYQLGTYAIKNSQCRYCQYEIPGHFFDIPGCWGPKRQPVNIQQFAQTSAESSMQDATIISKVPRAGIPELSERQKSAILALAAEATVKSVTGEARNFSEFKDIYDPHFEQLSRMKVDGVFVSLHKGEALRGCCGTLGTELSIIDALTQSANRTALHDHRFPPVSLSELPDLTIDISILGPSSVLNVPAENRPEAIEVGRHGLRIRSGERAGLLLPQVATEQQWTSLQFLQGVCRKAGLPTDAWKSPDVVVETFEGIAFGDKLTSFPLHQQAMGSQSQPDFLSTSQLVQLTRWVQHNFNAIQTGATPLYYATELPDGDVSGLVVTLQESATGKQYNASVWRNRSSIAMQSNLFQMVDSLAKRLPTNQSSPWHFSVAVLTDPQVLPSGQRSCSNKSFPKDSAVLGSSGSGFALAWDKTKSAGELLDAVTSLPQFEKEQPEILVYRCLSLRDKISILSFSQQSASAQQASMQQLHASAQMESARSNFFERQPAMAGRFYPANDQQREQLVSQLVHDASDKYLLKMDRETGDKQLLAVMTPHAGLVYSGTVAAAIWSQIKIPADVIIIGPKHTSHGARWAVAPHDQWRLSDTAVVPGNPELSRLLTEEVEGLELDAAAHQFEHGIEVQLPFLHKIAPATKVTAIAMQGGTIEQLRLAAKQLAHVLSKLDSPPLLVISSDMNHFADDHENRRRDALALAAFDSLAGETLLDVCIANQISMCGLLPAVLVLETVQLLATNLQSRQVAYATSAEYSGQTDRVVGYAGAVLLGERVGA